VIDIATLSVATRIKVTGQPNKMVLNADQSKLYVAEDETDTVDVIDTTMNSVTATISVGAPAGLLTTNRTKYTGNNTNSVSLSPDGKSLYVTNGNMNDVAVVDLSASPAQVVGLIPTGWYPTSVSTSADGTYMYVINYKSVTGPNPLYCQGGTGIPAAQSTACDASNSYDLQLIKAGFQSFPPRAAANFIN
jgi:YVTN family beta-propeller protein